MKEIKVVIGKNFGDEGKGATVASFCKGRKALVVRHNGGEQAGHMVIDEEKVVFHQLGSGSFYGCPTYWSNTFMPDLWKIAEEVKGLLKMRDEELGGYVTIYAHPECRCVIIYDVLLDNILKILQEKNVNNSESAGIHQAMLRSENPEYCVRIRDFETLSSQEMCEKIRFIREKYVLPYFEELKNQYSVDWNKPQLAELEELIKNEAVCNSVVTTMCENFKSYIRLAEFPELVERSELVVFENAYGLMMDKDNKEYYPHVSSFHTGLTNVVELIDKLELKERIDLEVVYVTRSYVTRYGGGRLDNECSRDALNPAMMDCEDVQNQWEEPLRYGKHPSGEEFFSYIQQDLMKLDEIESKGKLSDCRVIMRVRRLGETNNQMIFQDENIGMEEFAEWCERDYGIEVVWE